MVEATPSASQPIVETALATVAAELASARVREDVARRVQDAVRAALTEQRHFLSMIVDSLPVGLYVVDREYRVQAWNRKRETGMQGIARGNAIGRTIFDILHRTPAESLKGEIDRVFESGQLEQFETQSHARTYRISKIPMHLASDGEVTHVITIGEDITEWSEAQQRAAQAEKMAAIGQLAAGVMHEINNPLATISACAESLQLQIGDSEFLRFIDAEIERCKGIIGGLLDFSRKRPMAKELLDVNAVIERTLFLLSHHARFKRIAVKTELAPSAGARIRGNADQLVQVFMALLLNAADATERRGGSVTVRTRHDNEQVMADVIDDGEGIARSDIPKLFEPFYTTKSPGKGTGLGLSICYGIVADHGGRMEVESTLGVGSTFRIALPMDPVA